MGSSVKSRGGSRVWVAEEGAERTVQRRGRVGA